MMTTTSVLLCLVALLTIYSDSQAAGNINCRKFVYHPKCRGVAAKRADLPTIVSHRRPDTDRKQDDDITESEYLPVSMDVTNEALQPLPRRNNPPLWTYFAERPGNIMMAHRKFDPETLELSYDYE